MLESYGSAPHVGINYVSTGLEYAFSPGMEPRVVAVDEILDSTQYIADSRFRNTLSGGNNPHHEVVAYGYARNGKPVIAVLIEAVSGQQRAGTFKVVEGDWKDPPAGWTMCNGAIKSFTVETVVGSAIPLSGFGARWGKFWGGNNPEFDFRRSVRPSSQARAFYLWIKYD